MSNFRAMTRATQMAIDSGVHEQYKDWQPANWLDNFFSGRQYGIKFDNDSTVYRDDEFFEYNPDMEVVESGDDS